jgi:ABC-2 type transport system permease protein
MSAASPSRAFATVFLRDLRRQLLTAAQLTLFALMLVVVVLVVIAPKIVGAGGPTAPTVHVQAPDDVVAAVEALQPSWTVTASVTAPDDLGDEFFVTVDDGEIAVSTAKASQAASALLVGEVVSTAVLAVSAGTAPPSISHAFAVDDGEAVLSRVITLVATLLTFSILTGRAAWTFGALGRDLTLGLFDGVLARSSAVGLLGGRALAAVAAGVVQMLVLAAVAAATLVLAGESDTAARVLVLAAPLALWTAAGIALLVTASMVLVLLFRGGGTAALGIVIQLVGFGAFGVLIVALLDPSATWIAVASVIPPLSVVLLPVRLAEGAATGVHAAIAVGAIVVVVLLLFLLALRVWRAATTTDSASATWRAVIHAGGLRRPRARATTRRRQAPG